MELSADGQLSALSFEKFTRRDLTFGETYLDLPLSGTREVDDLNVTVDDSVTASESRFAFSYHAESRKTVDGDSDSEPSNAYDEGLEGTRSGDSLDVRYFIKGRLWGSAIDAHTSGTLLPAP